jgi:hypothetical protein
MNREPHNLNDEDIIVSGSALIISILTTIALIWSILT